MIVVVETRFLEALRLLFGQHAQGDAGLHAHIVHGAYHLHHTLQILVGGIAPGRTHTEAGRPLILRLLGRTFHFIQRQQFLLLQIGGMLGALRAVATIFGAGAGLDTQQGTHLHPVGVEALTMDTLRLKHQVIKRQIEQRLDLFQAPVVSCRHIVHLGLCR